MDDNLKIQTLMIYYKHWGNEQNQIRKILDGVEQFHQIYQQHGFMIRMSCRSYMKRHKRRTLYHIMQILMGKCGGAFQPIDMLPETKDRVDMLIMHTFNQSRIVEVNTYLNLLGVGFSQMEALSVNAIVALM